MPVVLPLGQRFCDWMMSRQGKLGGTRLNLPGNVEDLLLLLTL
jgi:hypothetical protein